MNYGTTTLGQNSSTITQVEFGSSPQSTTLASGAAYGITINFTNGFPGTPIVLVSINMTGSSSVYWDQCSIQCYSVSSTGFQATIRNLTASTASGTFNIVYSAFY